MHQSEYQASSSAAIAIAWVNQQKMQNNIRTSLGGRQIYLSQYLADHILFHRRSPVVGKSKFCWGCRGKTLEKRKSLRKNNLFVLLYTNVAFCIANAHKKHEKKFHFALKVFQSLVLVLLRRKEIEKCCYWVQVGWTRGEGKYSVKICVSLVWSLAIHVTKTWPTWPTQPHRWKCFQKKNKINRIWRWKDVTLASNLNLIRSRPWSELVKRRTIHSYQN